MNSTLGVGETHTNLAIRQTVVAAGSGAAGTYTIPGWTPGSSLKSVVNLGTGTDITSEFSDASGQVVRAAGNVASGNLLILFIAGHPRGGSLRRR